MAPSRRHIVGIALAALALAACTHGDPRAASAVRTPRAARSAPELQAPLLPPERTRDEQQRELQRLAAHARTKGSVRVLVTLRELVPPRSRPQRPGVLDREAFRARADVLARGQDGVIGRLSRARGGRMTRFRALPGLAFDATPADVGALVALAARGLPFEGRTVRVAVEEVAQVVPQRARRAASAVPIEAALARLDAGAATKAGLGRTVAVVDTPIEPLPVLLGRVTRRAEVLAADPVEVVEVAEPAPRMALPLDLLHGTQVGAVVAATAPAAGIVSVEVGGTSASYPFDHVLAALDWLIAGAAEGTLPALDAVCLSAGDPEQDSCASCTASPDQAAAFHEALTQLADAGALVVLAAGNSASGLEHVFFPGCVGTSVVVGATDGASVVRAGYSNWCALVDLAAPGTGITFAPDADKDLVLGLGPGTSIAAPFVAGAVALLRGEHAEAEPADVLAALLETGEPVTEGGITVPEVRVGKAAARLAEILAAEGGG